MAVNNKSEKIEAQPTVPQWKQQELGCLEFVMRDEHWDQLMNPAGTDPSKYMVLYSASAGVQCYYPGETSFKDMLVIKWLCSAATVPNFMALKTTTLEGFFIDLENFKKFFRSQRNKIKGISMATCTIKRYPDDPEQLKASYPDIYNSAFSDDGPAQCRLNPKLLQAWKDKLPTRHSKKLLVSGADLRCGRIAGGHQGVRRQMNA